MASKELKLCVDCKYHTKQYDALFDMELDGGDCKKTVIEVCPITGNKTYLSCSDQRRKEYGTCGMEANHWEPKPTLTQRIIALFK